MIFEEAYRDTEIRRRVRRGIEVSIRRGWFGPKPEMEDLEAEVWSRAWVYWEAISSSDKPVASLVMKGREVVQIWRERYAGSERTRRGKTRHLGGTWGRAGLFSDKVESDDSRGEVEASVAMDRFLSKATAIGRLRSLSPYEVAVLREELERVDYQPMFFFPAGHWNRFGCRERHFSGSDWKERLSA